MEIKTDYIEDKDLLSLLDVSIITINSEPKGGKLTFFLYALSQLYKEKAVFFTPMEKYLFQKKLTVLSKQFLQFQELHNLIEFYFLTNNFHDMKQKYGYDFILTEIEKIISQSDAKFFVLHRINDFFDYQDRFEIPSFYKKLIYITQKNNKKLVVLANTAHNNYQQVSNLTHELSDIIIDISKDQENNRLINILDVLHHKEHPQLSFKIENKNFILKYTISQVKNANPYKNILLVELNSIEKNIKELFEYILNKPEFNIKYANTLQEILQEVFVRPDLLVITMERTKENIQFIHSLKSQLKNTKIIAIINQEFVRTEDKHLFLKNGCETILSKEFSFDEMILALQKALDSLFYTSILEKLPTQNNILENSQKMQEIINECLENSIYFTSLIMKNKKNIAIDKISRKTDYICFQEDKICYLAINTLPKETKYIAKKYDLEIECTTDALNKKSIEECLK